MPLYLVYKAENTLSVRKIIFSQSDITTAMGDKTASGVFWNRMFKSSIKLRSNIKHRKKQKKSRPQLQKSGSGHIEDEMSNTKLSIEQYVGVQSNSASTECNDIFSSPEPSQTDNVLNKQMVDLYLYLRKYSHYQEFAKFLTECFALVILYHMYVCVFVCTCMYLFIGK